MTQVFATKGEPVETLVPCELDAATLRGKRPLYCSKTDECRNYECILKKVSW